jgi:hypothetical protein
VDDTTNPCDIPIVNEIAEATYPHRESYFAMSYLRLVSKCNAGQAIGPAGIALLAIVVTTEDQFRYCRAVDFFDDQLTPMLGLSSRKTLYAKKGDLENTGSRFQRNSKVHPIILTMQRR